MQNYKQLSETILGIFLIKRYFPLLCTAKCFFCRAVKAGIERTIQLFSSWYLFKTNQMACHIGAMALLLVTNSGCVFPVSSLLVNYLHLMQTRHKMSRKQNFGHFNLNSHNGRSNLCELFGELVPLLVPSLIQIRVFYRRLIKY